MKSFLFRALSLLAALYAPLVIFAQEKKEKGLDETINEWFAPVAAWWEKVVLFPIVFSENVQMPFVVLLLGAAGIFFTIYFSFVNVTKFGLAIQVTRGKFDNLEAKSKVHST